MTVSGPLKVGIATLMCLALVACGNRNRGVDVTVGGDSPTGPNLSAPDERFNEGPTIWDAFGPDRSEQTVQVNRYLWGATFDVLSFLPVQSVDPFTGIIVTGYGTPPGGRQSYRATVHITDPALAARSLRVSLQSRSGPVSAATSRAVEDAILSRARQLRIADDAL